MMESQVLVPLVAPDSRVCPAFKTKITMLWTLACLSCCADLYPYVQSTPPYLKPKSKTPFCTACSNLLKPKVRRDEFLPCPSCGIERSPGIWREVRRFRRAPRVEYRHGWLKKWKRGIDDGNSRWRKRKLPLNLVIWNEEDIRRRPSTSHATTLH